MNAMKQCAQRRRQERLAALDGAIRTLRKSPDNVEALHGVRVSTRRLQQCLRLFEGCFHAKPANKLRRRLRRLMDRCGPVRDWDIALNVLKAARLLTPELRARIPKERAKAQSRLVEELERWRGERSARAWAKQLPLRGCDWDSETLPNAVSEWFESGDRALSGDASDLHRFRLVGKRLRYSLELLDAAPSPLAALKKVQDTLGAISDCATTQALIPELGTQLQPQLDRRTAAFRILWASVRKQKAKWNSIYSGTVKLNLEPPAATTKTAR